MITKDVVHTEIEEESVSVENAQEASKVEKMQEERTN
jgi:hypothetical protein